MIYYKYTCTFIFYSLTFYVNSIPRLSDGIHLISVFLEKKSLNLTYISTVRYILISEMLKCEKICISDGRNTVMLAYARKMIRKMQEKLKI